MELSKARDIAMSLMNKHGLNNWIFKWDNDIGTLLGKCNYIYKIIYLSRNMTRYESNDNRIINTILHEISHALDYNKRGFTNHDKNWEKISKSIGCSGNRCGDSSGISKVEYSKIIGTCPNCKKEFYFNIKPKKSYSCSSCSSGYNKKYKLDYKFNPKLKTWEQFVHRFFK